MRADLAHIRGERAGAARFDPEMTDPERNSPDNLIVLCPNHHREIDRLRPQDWPSERLMQIKLDHESSCDQPHWADDGRLEFIASLVLADTSSTGGGTKSEPVARARLQVRKGDGDSYDVVNVGDGDAFNVQINAAQQDQEQYILRLEADGVDRLSPGGSWRALIYAPTMSDSGSPSVLVSWEDSDGSTKDASFPL